MGFQNLQLEGVRSLMTTIDGQTQFPPQGAGPPGQWVVEMAFSPHLILGADGKAVPGTPQSHRAQTKGD